MSVREILQRETADLPTEKVQEVLDFVLFLKTRNEDSFWYRVAESSLSEIWNSPEEDIAWKNL
ncbi:hypothetical protein [Spirochaeta dissipatitropha]